MSAAFSKELPFLLSATVDFPDDVGRGAYTHQLLDEMMVQLKSLGVRRVYWLYYGDIDPDSDWATASFAHGYGPETLERIGEPVSAAVPVAHRHGLEIYAVVKPYDLFGGWGTYPEGSPEANATNVKRIGATVRDVDPFLERHPHALIRRRPFGGPPDLLALPVKRIRLLKMDDSPTRIRKENLEIWTSPENYRYQRVDADFTLEEAVEPSPREVRDSFDTVVTAKGAPVRTLTLEGLDLTHPYVVITTNFKDQEGDFRNTALGMVEAYGPGPEPLPVVVATHSSMWKFPRDLRTYGDFRTYGLDFDSGFGAYLGDLDVDNTIAKENIRWRSVSDDGLIAFTKGKNETLVSAPCEAYPEVRKLWTGWIDRALQTGVDGVDVRLNSHVGCTDESFEYGFNEPLLEEYRQRFGRDLLTDAPDLEGLARVRGEHVTSFMRETSSRVRGAGKKMQFHMHPDAFRPNPSPRERFWSLTNIHYDWRTWLREGLVDGCTMRPSRFEGTPNLPPGEAKRAHISQTLADPVVSEMLALARETGTPVCLNGFVGLMDVDQYVDELETIFHDGRFGGFDVYECAEILRATPDSSRLVPVDDRLERIRGKVKELGLV